MIDHETLFWQKVEKTADCWNWTAAKHELGYGRVTINQRTLPAHRVAWQFLVGEIPTGMMLDHICHNTACVRPEHLRVVDSKKNQENREAESASSSGFRGVYWNKRRGDWEAKVCHNRKLHHVGYFTDLEEAKQSVTAKRLELFTHNDADQEANL